MHDEKRFALRVDIDTVRDLIDGVPPLLDICLKAGVKATFFATVGRDTAARAFMRSPRLTRHMAVCPLRKYGPREIAASLFGRDFGRHAERFREIEAKGHELQLHCYDHVEWVRKVATASPLQVEEMIVRGMDAFGRIMDRPPEAFASPSFMVTEAVLEAEEKLGFRYASDFFIEGDCIPFTKGRRVLQIPVNVPLPEDMVARGIEDERICSTIIDAVDHNSLTVMYIHPSYEALCRPDLLSLVLGAARDRAKTVTLGEIWRAWSPSN